MKKLFSIALLLLFLFNVVGYYLVFVGLRYQAHREMTERLDAEDYGIDETTTFKIPITVPYYADSKDFGRVSGDFEHDGEFYKLVKQKLERDTLYIVCIKDQKEKKLFSVMTDFVKVSNDLPASSQKTLKLLGGFIKDYTPASPISSLTQPSWSRAFNFVSLNLDLLATDLPVFSPPPDQLV